jgi:hypothetical protein
MSSSEIAQLEKDAFMFQRIVEQDEKNLTHSNDPSIERIFLASSTKALSKIQRQLYEAKKERAYELVRLRLIGNQMNGSIPLRALVKLIAPFNQALEQSAWRVWDKEGDGTKIHEKFVSLLDLRLEGLNPGSTELAVLGNTSPDLTGTSALEDGLKNVFALLNCKNEEISDHINDVGLTAAKALSDLMIELDKNAVAVEMKWNAPGESLFWEGRPAEIARIRTILEEIGEPATETLTIRGRVQVLSVRNRIEILPDNNGDRPEKIVAGYHHSLMDEIQDLRLGDRRDFLIEKSTYPLSMSKKKKSAYRLKEIQLLDMTREPDSP